MNVAKQILVRECCGLERSGEYVRVAVPFAKGEQYGTSDLTLSSAECKSLPVQVEVLNCWNDGSLKWIIVDFAASASANGTSLYRLAADGTKAAPDYSTITVTPGNHAWFVDTGAARFTVDARQFRPFSRITMSGRDILAHQGAVCTLQLDGKTVLQPTVERLSAETTGPLHAILRLEGSFDPVNELSPRFVCRIHFHAGSSMTFMEFTLHNPQPARHSGGLWDLGDQGGLHIREASLEFPFPDNFVENIVCTPAHGIAPVICSGTDAGLCIYQESSGGDNWQSPVHRSSNGIVPHNSRGYEIRRGADRIGAGGRATPVIWSGREDCGFAAILPHFWQGFPKAFDTSSGRLKISLLPSQFPVLHELQGGEQMTTIIYLDVSTTPTGLEWARAPLTALSGPEVFRRSGVVTDLPSPAGECGGTDLVDLFLPGPEVLLNKREAIDEYGWRNFGELFADHEAVYHEGSTPFVSHYNNQYDPCSGMYRKFLATGNPLWGELAADLARHLLDIDIYHTDRDREEYNRGPFWHTDHYLPAGLSTHRSFSREHLKVKDPRFCGGGPGVEHCYTTGLMLHYFLTGNPLFREAVIDLAEWCIRSLNGSRTILGVLNRSKRTFALLRSARGESRPTFPRYPLSRGTGNAITACLDAFEVHGGRKFITQAEEFIRGTIHPADDIAARNLLDAESCWSYTVLLVAVARYLDKKRELDELDEEYAYGRECLLSYADWMRENEYPYLDKPELLEYPNETWPAQDLRKSVIFIHAARHADAAQRDSFLKRARFFYDTSKQELLRHPTSASARPLALMLQNGWIESTFHEPLTAAPRPAGNHHSFGVPTPRLGIPAVAARLVRDLSLAIRETSLPKEISWLTTRINGRTRSSTTQSHTAR